MYNTTTSTMSCFRPGSPMPRSNSVVMARAKFEATIRQNSIRGDGRSKTFLTNVAVAGGGPRRHSSASSYSPSSPPRTNRARRQSSLTNVRDIEAEYNKITGCLGDDAESVQSLPATFDYQYAKHQQQQDDVDDNASIASTIVSYNDVGDYMYFDACPAEEASWQQQLNPQAHGSGPPTEIRAATSRFSPVGIHSPLGSPTRNSNNSSDSFRRKKRVFERHKHANKSVKIDLAPLLVKAAFATGGASDYGCNSNSSVGSSSSVSSLGEILVDIYEQSRQQLSATRRGSDTTSTERSESPTEQGEYDPNNSTTNAVVFTIIEEDEELSTSSSEAMSHVKPSPVRRAASVIDPRAASPSFFLSRFKRATSLSGKDLFGSGSSSMESSGGFGSGSSEPRKKSLTKRGVTRSTRLTGRRQGNEVLY